ncbi:hypothetical protein [Streptomyces sp. NPDC058295]|uniref:hypothetical protein n=1 Tax=Streptomyces sp. NPDC058295 TaxID=3346431 RepID=UPI0036E25C92
MSDARTLHEELAQDLLDDITASPAAAAVFAGWRRRFKEGDYDPAYVARIGQTQRDPAYWPLEQVAAFVAIHAGLMAGRFAHVEVDVGHSPGPDADRSGNAVKLQEAHPLFHADLDMHQNGADCDGWLSWEEPIAVNKSSGLGLVTGCGTSPVEVIMHVDSHGVPLEVGSSKASRTYLHLLQEDGVARWAYGDDRIYLLLNVQRVQAWARGAQQAA